MYTARCDYAMHNYVIVCKKPPPPSSPGLCPRYPPPPLPLTRDGPRPFCALHLAAAVCTLGCKGKQSEWPVCGKGDGILSLCIYNMPTVSTISRLRLLVAHHVYRLQTTLVSCTGKRRERPVFFGKRAFGTLPKYCHFASTTC